MREIAGEIIERAARGDMRAFEEVYKTFSPAVYTIAFNITHSRQDAEEAAQDVFVKIYKNLRYFKFESSFGTWVYRIAVNTAINIYKGRDRHRRNAVNFDEVGDVTDPQFSASKDAIERESAESKVASLLMCLSTEHRSCLILRELEGLDYKEMADVLKIPLNTVRSRLKRARKALVDYCRQISKEGFRYGM